jgi:hypothetical protein
MGTLHPTDGSAEAVPLDHASLAEQRVSDLLRSGDVSRAREVIEDAIGLSRRRSDLLWLLADVEFADGDQRAGMTCLADAVSSSVDESAAIGMRIRKLSENNLWREALKVVEHVPVRLRDDPAFRTAAGNFYKARGCRGHAVGAYGDGSGLSFSAQANRLISWLSSGGIFTFARRRVIVWEESELLSDMRKGRRASPLLDNVRDLDSRDAQRLKVRMENANYVWNYNFEMWSATFRWQLRLLPTAFLPVWLVLYEIVSSVAFLSSTPGVVSGTAISAGVAILLPIFLLRSQVRSDLSLRGSLTITTTWFVFLCILAVLSEIALAEGYGRHLLPTTGWWAWIVFGLAVLPAVSACMLVSAAVMTVIGSRHILSAQRENCQVILLDMFLSMILDLKPPSGQFDLAQRQRWSLQLEWAARRISRDLLPQFFLRRVASGDWLRRRSAGWAEALRYMQRELVAPVPGGWPKLEAKLWHQSGCLATGDLGALAWRQPPPSPSRRVTLARKAIEVMRTVLVAALPLGAVLASQAVVHFSGQIFRWAGIATGTWALLYVVISLDPAIRDKIETARTLTGTLHEARKID